VVDGLFGPVGADEGAQDRRLHWTVLGPTTSSPRQDGTTTLQGANVAAAPVGAALDPRLDVDGRVVLTSDEVPMLDRVPRGLGESAGGPRLRDRWTRVAPH
jgi:hypothetical protein